MAHTPTEPHPLRLGRGAIRARIATAHRGRIPTAGGQFAQWCACGALQLALWVALAFLPNTAGAAAPRLLSGPNVSANEDGTALVIWRTDVPTGTRVQYGLTPTALSRRANGEVAELHSAKLTELQPGTRYYYAVGTAKLLFVTNTFLTPGRGGAASPTGSSLHEPTPPAALTWGHLPSLADHFQRHGSDFRAADAEEYARLAWAFLQRGRRDRLPAKVDENGTVRVFDPRTRTFAAYNRDGTTKTFFKAQSTGYFERQPGRSINLQTHTFLAR